MALRALSSRLVLIFRHTDTMGTLSSNFEHLNANAHDLKGAPARYRSCAIEKSFVVDTDYIKVIHRRLLRILTGTRKRAYLKKERKSGFFFILPELTREGISYFLRVIKGA